MPSSPQTVTTRGVFDYLYNSAGKAIVGATVNCTLNFNGSSVTSPIVNLGELQQTTVTDQNGFWRFNLVPNDTITPTGTLYTIQSGNIANYEISVPSGGADVQSSSILANTPSVLSPAATGLTGPITVTGNETVTGNLSVSGTTTLGATTTGALTTAAETVGGDLTIGNTFRLLFATAAAKIIPGATSISHRNNADNADNVLITDAGAVTVRNGLTVTAGGETVTAGDMVVSAGRLLVSAAAAKILGGATSLSLRNNADSADNVLVADAGAITLRNALSIPPAASGTVAPTSYGSVPIKYDEQAVTTASLVIPASGSIPSTFRLIRIAFKARTSSANGTDFMQIQFNGDSGANYDDIEMDYSTGAVSAANRANQTSARVAIAAGGTATAGQFTKGWIEIFNYGSAEQHHYNSQSKWGTTVTASLFNGTWHGTAAAITSITLTFSAGNWASGTLVTTWLFP